MLKVKIFTVGKNKEQWISNGISEYEKRLQGIMHFKWFFFKTVLHLKDAALKENFFLCLDVLGDECDSYKFSKIIFKLFETQNSRLTFVIGDACGLPIVLKEKSIYNISLSKLTFTHQMTRLILIEQLYRAEQLMKNTKYQR